MTTKTLVLSPFTINLQEHSDKHGISFPDESLATQADRDQSDINHIVKQFGLTHQLPYGVDVPRYDDFTNTPSDYHAAMNFIKESDSLFMEYPAEIRKEFDNDAGKFLDFLNDDKNRDRAVELGFVLPNESPLEAPAPNNETPTSPKDASAAQSPT